MVQLNDSLMAGIVILVIAICILAGTTVNNYLDTVDNQQEREHHETMAKLGWVYDDNEERWVPIGTRKERTDIKDEGELRTKEPRVSPEA